MEASGRLKLLPTQIPISHLVLKENSIALPLWLWTQPYVKNHHYFIWNQSFAPKAQWKECFILFSEGIMKLLQLCCLGSKENPGAGIRLRSSVYALLILKTWKTEQKDVCIGLQSTTNTLDFGRLKIGILWQNIERSLKEPYFSCRPI